MPLRHFTLVALVLTAACSSPAEIAEKMVDGRMRKYFEEVTLLAQTFVIDGETKPIMLFADQPKVSGSN